MEEQILGPSSSMWSQKSPDHSASIPTTVWMTTIFLLIMTNVVILLCSLYRKKQDEEPGMFRGGQSGPFSVGNRIPYKPRGDNCGSQCSVILEKSIGCGATAEVWECKEIHNGKKRSVAVKIFNKESEEAFHQESEILMQISNEHPNILCTYGSGNFQGYYFLVQELMSMDLQNLMQPAHREQLTFDKLVHIFLELAKALRFLEGCNLVHYDLKPSNVLLSSGQNGKYIVKVADFGCSKWKFKSIFTTTGKGTLGYMPPELYGRSVKVNSKRLDVFSFGRTLYACVTGHQPGPVFDEIKDFNTGDVFPEELYKLLNECDQKTASKRPTWEKVINSLTCMTNEAWFHENVSSFKNNHGSHSSSPGIAAVDTNVNSHHEFAELSLPVHGGTSSSAMFSSGRIIAHKQKRVASLERQRLWAPTTFSENM